MNIVRYILTSSRASEWFENNMPNGISHNFLLLSKSNIQVRVDGKLQLYPPNTAFYFPKYTPFYYCTCEGEPYEDAYIQFDVEGTSFTENLLPVGKPIFLTDVDHIYDIMHVIAYENYVANKYQKEILDQLMNALILKLHGSLHPDKISPHYYELLELRQGIYEHPEYDWSLEELAKKVNISPNYVHALYKETFHITCNQDWIQSRIRAAKHQLVHTSRPVYQIAALVGYHDAEHFYRQFKKIVGISPVQYRKKNQ